MYRSFKCYFVCKIFRFWVQRHSSFDLILCLHLYIINNSSFSCFDFSNTIFTLSTILSGVQMISHMCQYIRYPKKRQRAWGLNILLWKWASRRLWIAWKKRSLPTFNLWYLLEEKTLIIETLCGWSLGLWCSCFWTNLLLNKT